MGFPFLPPLTLWRIMPNTENTIERIKVPDEEDVTCLECGTSVHEIVVERSKTQYASLFVAGQVPTSTAIYTTEPCGHHKGYKIRPGSNWGALRDLVAEAMIDED